METISASTEQTKELAVKIGGFLKPGDVLLLSGELGAGKTTFTRYLVEAMRFEDRVQSPTFILHRIYRKAGPKSLIKEIHHLDLYRITDKSDLTEVGIPDILKTGNSIVIVEWPDQFRSELPKNSIEIKIDYVSETKRRFNVQNIY